MTSTATDDTATDLVRKERLGSPSQHNPLMHRHDGLEILRVEKGCMDCVAGDRSSRLEQGESCIINGGRMHMARAVPGHPCTYSVLHLDPERLTRDEEVFSRYIAPVLEDESFNFMLGRDCAGTAAEVCRLMDEIVSLERAKPPAYELEVIALAHLVFKQIYLRREQIARELESSSGSSDAVILRQMTAHIYAHFSERVTLDDIARAGGVSKSKCTALFRDQLGSSPVEFLNRYRMEAAELMLASTDDTVARIAASCGFSQQSYFNRVFLKEHGVTPRQYRLAERANAAGGGR